MYTFLFVIAERVSDCWVKAPYLAATLSHQLDAYLGANLCVIVITIFSSIFTNPMILVPCSGDLLLRYRQCIAPCTLCHSLSSLNCPEAFDINKWFFFYNDTIALHNNFVLPVLSCWYETFQNWFTTRSLN